MSPHNLAIVCSSHTPDWCYENTDTSSAVMMLCVMKTLHCHCFGYIHLLGQMLGPAIMERGRQDINNSVMFCNCSSVQLPKDGNWEMRVWVQQKMLHNKSDITCWLLNKHLLYSVNSPACPCWSWPAAWRCSGCRCTDSWSCPCWGTIKSTPTCYKGGCKVV